jgi:hypothetical protein
MAKAMTRIVRAFCLLSLLLHVGCSSDDERASELDSLRIIAVRADHPYAAPASSVALEMLVDDASPKASADDNKSRSVHLLWLSGCVNPDGDLYYNCFPELRKSLSQVSDAELNAGKETESTESANVGFGSQYQLKVPDDVITSRSSSSDVTYPYGVIVMFYAACAGELRVERDSQTDTGYPVGCYDAETNKPLGQADFEFGFYPIYIYDELQNQLPIVESTSFSESASGDACDNHDDCTSAEACSENGYCIPRIAACKSDDCKTYDWNVVMDEQSVERALSAQVSETDAPLETLWISYYTDYGTFDEDSRIIHDAGSGFTKDYHGVWKAKQTKDSPPIPREAHLYAVIRDSRGGVTWVTQNVFVE